MYKKSNNKGFTMTEALITLLISSVVLTGFYQLIFGSVAFFSKNKVESDNLETKTPSMELISRYFDRWGVGVVVNSATTDVAYKRNVLPNTENYIYLPASNAKATEDNPITFYANLSGFGFVRGFTGTTANLLSCRLDDDLGKKSGTTPCYYVFRNNKFIPDNLNQNGNITTGTGSGQEYTNDSGSVVKLPRIDSVSFSTAFASTTGAKECTDTTFSSNISNNGTISKSASIIDSVTTSIPVTISGNALTPTTFDLQEGDLIFRAPHRVQLYIKNNSNDDNKEWLYIKLTPVADNCREAFTEDAIAPASHISGVIPNGATRGVTIKINFRAQDYKKQNKEYIVERTFGGP